MTREQVEKEMAQYRTIFTVVRLLEAAQVCSDKTLSDYCKCYDVWQKHTQCQNCCLLYTSQLRQERGNLTP